MPEPTKTAIRLYARPGGRLVIALLIPFVTAGVQWLLWPWIHPLVWVLFYPAVYLSCRIGGRRGGLIATAVSAVLALYLFMPPRLTFSLSKPNEIWQVGAFVLGGLLIVDLQGRFERAQETISAAAEETESKYRALVNQTLVGIYVVQDGVFRFVNPRMAEILGYDNPDDIVGKLPIESVVARDDWPAAQRRLAEAQAGSLSENVMRSTLIRADGMPIVIERHGIAAPYEGRPAVIGAVLDITEQVRAEELLEKREAMLAMTSELAHVGGWELDARTGAGEWTDEIARIHDLDPSIQPNAEMGLRYYAPDSRPVIEHAVDEALHAGTPYDLELELVSAKGVQKWIRTTGQPVFENGKVVRLRGTMQDITERHYAEQVKLETEESYHRLFDSMIEGMALCEMIFDETGSPVDWRYLDVNPAFSQITGITGAVGTLVSELIPGIRESNPELFDIYGRVAKSGVPETFESFVPLLPRHQWLHVAVTRPQPNQFMALFTDITERREAEEALLESEQKYRQLVEQSPDGIFLADTAGNYVDVNPAGAAMLGYTPEEVRGLTFLDVLVPSEVERLASEVEHLEAGDERHTQWLCRRKDGSTFVGELVGVQLPTGYLQGILRDVTDRVEAEAQIRELNATLERRVEQRTAEVQAANKELESFAYAVSHDLRAPLRAMSGFAQALVEDYGEALDTQAREYTDHIVAGSHQMAELIDGLLTLSRSTRGELARARVDVTAVAQGILDELAKSDPERHVDCTVEPGLETCGDSRMVEVLMRNLLGNAWKYTVKAGNAHIDVHSEAFDGKQWICVRDNGAGYDPEYSAQLFQPFRRLHRQDEFPGIGIGLATVQRIVDRHGGVIRSTGAVNAGATFCFALPSPDDAPVAT